MREITVSWKVAWLTIIAHANICYRITWLLVMSGWLLAWLFAYSWDFSLADLWQRYKMYILFTILMVHFGPVNIYAVKRLASKPYARRRYHLKVFKQ